MLFFRIYQHLLPQATAWRLTIETTLRRYWLGLSAAPADVRAHLDQTWRGIFPDATDELALWERQFGLLPAATEADRRLQLAVTWAAQGGQSPSYLEGLVRSAGFDVYLYEWWTSGPPYMARDPRTYTTQPEIGTVQCGEPLAQCTAAEMLPPDPLPDGVTLSDLYPQCNRFLRNEPGYLVNDNLTPNAPPGVPDDPDAWPYFVYWSGSPISVKAQVPATRRAELERMLLKYCPEHCWIVTHVDYV
jgi:hypothetical protein